MHIIETLPELQKLQQSWKTQSVALVPTMGALHQGHTSLFEKAKTFADKVVVSIYVNPLQFGPQEDLERYPRPKDHDLAVCEEHDIDAVFYPNSEDLHPTGYDSLVQVVPPQELVNQFCGKSRPSHFTGVATIVLKLFNLVQPQYAVFGEKDAQQLAIIQKMVTDLNVPTNIVPAPTIRESDGLAVSSRNWYLTPELRHQARLLSRILATVQLFYQQGMTLAKENFAHTLAQVVDAELYPDFELEYIGAVDNNHFRQVDILEDTSRILIAAKVGNVRLIDNTMVIESVKPTHFHQLSASSLITH